MLTIPSTMLRELADQSPDALGTVLANMAFDRSRRLMHGIVGSIRPDWTSETRNLDPILQAAFLYDREFIEAAQIILLHTHPEQDYAIITAQIMGESEVDCLILGDGFTLVTGNLFSTGWREWDKSDEADVTLSDILKTIGR